MAKVLGLDLSTRVGWALFKDKDSAPDFGTYKLKKVFDPDDYGTRCWELFEWVEGMIAKYQPEILALEGPFIPMGPQKAQGTHSFGGKPAFVTTAQTLRLQIALATTIETVAKKHKIRCLEVATSSAKVALAGTARLGEAKKQAMVQAAWARGWQVADDHQADAIGVCLVVYDSLGE